jgi:hypothetical protein
MSSSSIKTFAHNSSDIKLVLEGEKLQKRPRLERQSHLKNSMVYLIHLPNK